MQHRPSLAERVQRQLLRLTKSCSALIASIILGIPTALAVGFRTAGARARLYTQRVWRVVQPYGRFALTIAGVVATVLIRLLTSTILEVSSGLWRWRRALLAISATCGVGVMVAIWLPGLLVNLAPPSTPVATAIATVSHAMAGPPAQLPSAPVATAIATVSPAVAGPPIQPPSPPVATATATVPVTPKRLSYDFLFDGTSPEQRLGQTLSLASGGNNELVATGFNTVLILRLNAVKAWEHLWYYELPTSSTIATSDPLNVSIVDIDGSGSFDLIVGAPAFFNDSTGQATGAVLIFLNPLDRLGRTNLNPIPDVIITGDEPGSGFGLSVAGVNDVNSDGYGDILVSAPYSSDGAGAVFLFNGARIINTEVDAEPQAETYRFARSELRPDRLLGENARFGMVIRSGDLDGDSVPELLVTAPGTDQCRGTIYLFHIDGDPFEAENPPKVKWSLQGEQPGEQFGYSAVFLDNPSSRELLVVGGPGYVDAARTPDKGAAPPNSAKPGCIAEGLRQGEGRITVYNDLDLIDRNGPSDTILGWQNGMQLGSALYDIGDFNQDNEHDLLVGAIGFDASADELNAGTVALYISASADSFSDKPFWQVAGPWADSGFATTLAGREFGPGVGFVVLVGAPYYSPQTVDGNAKGGLLLYVVNR